MGTKEDLLELLSLARDEELIFTSRATAADRTSTGLANQWAPKDELAHIAEWKFITATYLDAGLDGRSYSFYEDLDSKNAEIFESYRDLPWLEVLDALERGYRRLVRQVEAMEELDLVEADRFSWLDGQSFWMRVVHNGYYHPLWHLAMLYMARDQRAYGTQIMERVTRQVLSLDDTPNWQGHYLYNLACYYALGIDKLRAIKILADAFSMRPELIDISQEDPDLSSVWNEPAFKALVGIEDEVSS